MKKKIIKSIEGLLDSIPYISTHFSNKHVYFSMWVRDAFRFLNNAFFKNDIGGSFQCSYKFLQVQCKISQVSQYKIVQLHDKQLLLKLFTFSLRSIVDIMAFIVLSNVSVSIMIMGKFLQTVLSFPALLFVKLNVKSRHVHDTILHWNKSGFSQQKCLNVHICQQAYVIASKMQLAV